MGYAAEAPYDAIHVGAAAPVVPQAVSCFFFSVCVLYSTKALKHLQEMTSIDVENTIYVTLCPFFFLADNYAQFVT